MIIAFAVSASIMVALVGGLMTLAAALGGLAGFNAYKSAASGWREERDAAVAKANRLDAEVIDLRQRMTILERELELLRSKDTTKVYDMIREHHLEVVDDLKVIKSHLGLK